MSRQVVAYMITSLDGVASDPQTFVHDRFDEDMSRVLSGLIEDQDAVLLGRVTYDEWSAHWPDSDHQPFADFINGTPKYVVSRTLVDPTWAKTTVTKDVASTVNALKQEAGGTIGVHGSVRLVRSMLEAGLVDKLKLAVFPAVAGDGVRLFGSQPQRYALADVERTGSGVVVATYRRHTEPA